MAAPFNACQIHGNHLSQVPSGIRDHLPEPLPASCFISRTVNERLAESDKALVALKLLASQLLAYDTRMLIQALRAGELHEVESDE